MPHISTTEISSLNDKFENSSAFDILNHAANKIFIDEIALVSSYGAEAIILLHMVSQIDKNLPIIFIDTGKLFGETKRYRNEVNQKFNLTNIITHHPDEGELKQADPEGKLWSKDTNACCHTRKTLPYQRATQPYKALITGRKRFQSKTRSELNIFETSGGQIKVNPLADWSLEQLKEYIIANQLPRHPLVADGYLSIGCMPCTDKVTDETDYRDGRWSGQQKTECGIHLI